MLQTYTGNFIALESEGSYPGDPWYWDNVVFGYNSTNSAHQTIHLAFTTPSFIGDFKEISFCIQGQFGLTGVRFRYALCTSNANRDTYKNSSGMAVSDQYQLVSGITSLTEKGTGYTTGVDKFILTLSTVQLQPNTKYYLFFWDTEDSIYLGKNAEFIIRRLESINHLPYCTYTLTYNSIGFAYIDNNSEYTKYQCYIDTEYVGHDKFYNCNIIGQRYCHANVNLSGEINDPGDYSETLGAIWGAGQRADIDVGENYYSYHMKFTTPNFVENFNNITFNIVADGPMHETGIQNKTMHYALCMYDTNYDLYATTTSSVSDVFQIASGTFDEKIYSGSVNKIVIDSISTGQNISPNTEYYLIVWGAGMMDTPTYIKSIDNHTVTMHTTSENTIYDYKFELYTPYIDTGTTWEPL